MLWPHCLVPSTQPHPLGELLLSSHVLLSYLHLLAKDPVRNSLGGTTAAYFAETLFKTWYNTPLNIIYLTWAGNFLQSEALGKVVLALRPAAVNQYFFPSWTMKIITHFRFNSGCQETRDEMYDSTSTTVSDYGLPLWSLYLLNWFC